MLMMSSDDAIRIPLSIEPDSSGLDDIIAKANEADAVLQRLKASAVSSANALKISGPGGSMQFGSFGGLQQFGNAAGGMGSAFPELRPVLTQISQREMVIAQALRAGSAVPAGGAQTTADTRAEDKKETAAKIAARGRSSLAERPPSSFGDRFASHLTSSMSSMTTLGAFATGDLGSVGRTLASVFIDSIRSSPKAGGALAGSLVGDATSGASVVAATAGADAGATEAGTAVAGGGMAGAAMAIPIVGGIIAATAVALGSNAMQTQVAQQRQALEATTAGNVSPRDLLAKVLGSGKAFNYDEATALKTATTLGNAGVNGRQLGGALDSTFALARVGNMAPADAAGITSSLMVQGGQSTADLAKSVEMITQTVKDGRVPMSQFVASLQAVKQATGGLGLSVGGVAGLLATSSLYGNNVNAGGFLGPALGATGFQAITAESMLGVSPDTFAKAQSNPAMMSDLIANFSHKQFGAHPTTMQTQILEGELQSVGLTNNAAAKTPADLTALIKALANQQPNAAQKQADKAASDATALLATNAAIAARHLSENLVSAADQTAQDITYLGLTAFNAAGGTPTKPSNAANKAGVTATPVDGSTVTTPTGTGPFPHGAPISPDQAAAIAKTFNTQYNAASAQVVGQAVKAGALPANDKRLNAWLASPTTAPPLTPTETTSLLKFEHDHHITITFSNTGMPQVTRVQSKTVNPARTPLGHRTHGPAPKPAPVGHITGWGNIYKP
jgi:hypothetical protein